MLGTIKVASRQILKGSQRRDKRSARRGLLAPLPLIEVPLEPPSARGITTCAAFIVGGGRRVTLFFKPIRRSCNDEHLENALAKGIRLADV